MLKKGARRWYDPETGRFTSLDPARDGINWYGYCANNPLCFIDPTGLDYSSYGEAFGYSYSNYESGRLAGGEAAGGGGGSDWHPDWSDKVQATWDPFMRQRLAEKHIYVKENGWAGNAIDYNLVFADLMATPGIKPGVGGAYGFDDARYTLSDDELVAYIKSQDPIERILNSAFRVPGSEESGDSLSFWQSFVTNQEFIDKRADNLHTYCNWFATEKVFDLDDLLGMVGIGGNLYDKLFNAIPTSSQRSAHLNAGMQVLFAALQNGANTGKLIELDEIFGFNRAFTSWNELGSTMKKIQDLADKGVFIVGFYNNSAGTDHIFFISNSNLGRVSYAKVGAANPPASFDWEGAPSYKQVMVTHAGTYSGNMSIGYAVNNWNDFKNNPWKTGELHFYAVAE